MPKFNTTNPNLFNNKNKEQVPEWMEKVADIQIKNTEPINYEYEKKGVFAEKTQVYRPDLNAEPRYLDQYNKNKIVVDAKINLARFLGGKKYQVLNSSVNGNSVSLNVEIGNVPASFNFPFEVAGTKLQKLATFYVNDSEYPFSVAGLNECISDIKNGTLKTSSISRNMENGYIINREEIIRRYNGSLRQATDKINQLLKDGTIVGVGSNSYGTYYSVDDLFPKMEKERGQERLAEFHFAPNQEHIDTNEHKTSEYLKVEASKILKKHFKNFFIGQSKRTDEQLIIQAKVANNKGVKEDFIFGFDIQNEKLIGDPKVKYNGKTLTIKAMATQFNNDVSNAVNLFAQKNNSVDERFNAKHILTKKDIEDKLFKVANVSKTDSIIDSWISNGLIEPINSKTFATKYSFPDLLNKVAVDIVSGEELEEIEEAENKFGKDILVETDIVKPKDYNVELSEVESSREKQINNINNYISRKIKNYRVASISAKGKGKYKIDVELINKKTGTRHSIPLDVNVDNAKVISCFANINGKSVDIDNLLEHFTKNKILSLYLQDKNYSLNAGPILITEKGIRNKLAKVITASKVDKVLGQWINEGSVVRLDEEHLASEHSFQELLSNLSDEDMISISEMEQRGYQERHFGRQLKVNVDENIKDTGVRQAEDNWSHERKIMACSDKISKIFKQYELLDVKETEDLFYVTANVKNPLNGVDVGFNFSFKNNEGKVGNIISISDEDESVSIDKVANLLQKHTSDASKQYSRYNKLSKQSHNTLINKNNLQTKLQVVAKRKNIENIVSGLVERGFIQPINSTTYASKFTIGELVSLASNELDTEGAIEEMMLAKKEEQQLKIPDKRVSDNDTRELRETKREIDDKLSSVKEKLITYTYKAARDKKITMNKCGQFLQNLEDAKTVYDLEKVSQDLKRYYK